MVKIESINITFMKVVWKVFRLDNDAVFRRLRHKKH